ncbi:MAG: transglutaminase-like domain-containing protein [Gammaproteobacteria bacterium]|nr:transglutaminase-like domain-containing protein [Gammaproteobacteria bacterium]
MTFSKMLTWSFLLLLWGSLAGCENAQTEQPLDRIRATFFDPQHYVVAHEGLPIGTYTRVASLTDTDEYEFRTTLTMPSANGLILATDAVYQFQKRSPYLLSAATRTTYTESKDRPYRVEQLYPFANSDVDRPANEASKKKYGLQDFFALELALMANIESVEGELVSVPTPFHKNVKSTKWTISYRGDQSVMVSSTAGDRATFSFQQGLPRLEELIDDTGLSMQWISVVDFDALNFRPPHVVEDIRIPVDQPIERPGTLTTLTVQFEFDDAKLGPWSTLLDARNTLTTSTELKPSSLELFEWGGELLDRSTAQKLRPIVAEAIKGIDDAQLIVDTLVAYVNRTITYKNWNTLQSVEETIAQKIGDCTEFAQLFTALATAAELPTRTVVGLAYHESSQTFGIHAWNEVLFEDGSTRIVDPTWNQIRADATHIEFPPAYQHEIVSTLKNLRIKVLKVEHSTDHST